MKKLIALLAVFTATVSAAMAFSFNSEKNPVYVNDLQMTRVGDQLVGSFNLDASRANLSSNEELVFTPYLKGGSGVEKLSSVTVAGRNRYYRHLRNDAGNYTVGQNLFHDTNKAVSSIPYSFSVPYQEWMNNCALCYESQYLGCCGKQKAVIAGEIASLDMAPRTYEEVLVYEAPKTEKVKIRQESGSAYIDFQVGKSVILPDFRNNPAELAKIKESIDAVRNDKDLTIKQINITGYASPEGPETLNNKLAAERAASLLAYVKGLYNFPSSVKLTSTGMGEDWNGVKQYVAASTLENKGGILDIINNSALTDDQKDARIKADFPKDYAYLLENVYPSLRRSDYVVEFSVRDYANVAEIRQVLNTNPRKLSLNEIFIAAETMQPGSDEYNNAFLTAVTLFPNDETANLNAASVAMNKGDYAAAAAYLAKAGNSDMAIYNRGVLAAKQADYQTAKKYFQQVKGVPEAKAALEQVEAIIINPAGGVNISDYVPAIYK